MTEPMKMLNMKVPQSLRDLIDRAVKVSGAASMSEWAREALQAGATQELEAHKRATGSLPEDGGSSNPSPSRPAPRGVHRGSIGRVQRSGCVHPTTARFIGVTEETCTLCGAVVRRRL